MFGCILIHMTMATTMKYGNAAQYVVAKRDFLIIIHSGNGVMTTEIKFRPDDDLANLFRKASEYIDSISTRRTDEISGVVIEQDDSGGWHLFITFVI